MKEKYRLTKRTYMNGFVLWIIQKRFLFWWEFMTSETDERKARDMFRRLKQGETYYKEEPNPPVTPDPYENECPF